MKEVRENARGADLRERGSLAFGGGSAQNASFRADDSLLYALLVCIPGTSPRRDRLPQSWVGAGGLGAPLPRVRRIGKRDLAGGDSTYDRRTQCGCGGRFRHAACGAAGRLKCSCRKLRGSWLVAAAQVQDAG